MGLNVIEASDGADGLEKLEDLHKIFGDRVDQEVRVIISDVEMPKMDGFNFASHFKKDPRFKKIPLIFNSSISDHFSDIRGEEAGADAYLTKFNGKEFYKVVADAITKNEANLTLV